MTFTLLLRRSAVPGHAPTTSQLQFGELSVNTNDAIIYFMANVAGSNTIIAISNTPQSANSLTTARTIGLSGDATGSVSFNGTSNVTIATTLANTGVTAGTYNSVVVNSKGLVTSASSSAYLTNLVASGDASGTSIGNAITLTLATVNSNVGTFNTLTVNAKGLVTSASNTPYITNVVASGDASGTSVGNAVTLTLATVNSNVGVFGTTTIVPTITVNGKGLITAVSNSAIAFPVTSVFGRTGAVTLQSSDVTGALGYTPQGNAIVVTGDVSGTSTQNALTLTLATVGTAGTYTSVVTNAKGLVTSGTNLAATGDATGTASGSNLPLTLATVNSAVGTFGSATLVPAITVNAKGLVTNVTTQVINVVSALGYTPVNNAIVGVANGIATLDGSGKLTASQIPSSIVGAVVYQGTWDAFTNSPTLTSSVGTKGYYYKVSNAGSTTLNGISTWNLNDTVIYDGTTWDKIDGITNEVLSVFGRTGVVTLQSSDVTTALGYTPQGTIVASGDVSGTSTQNAITLTLASVVTAGTFSVVGYNAKGLVTSGANLAVTGDVSGTANGAALALTLATVNSTAGTFGTTTVVPTIVVNGKGLVTSVSNSAIAFPVTSVFGRTGAVTLQSSDVTGALGYVPQGNAIVVTGDVSGTSTQNALTLTLASITTAGTFSIVTYNAKGQVTSGQNLVVTGDTTGTASGNTVNVTLATVNSNVGTFGNAIQVSTITVNAKGLVTAASNTPIIFPVTSVFGRTGAVTLQSSDVTGALGYTPVNNAIVGVANGIATLNANGIVTASQLPTSTLYGPIVASGDASGTSVGNAITLTLATVGSVGTFTALVTDAKGRVTSGSNMTASGDATGTASGTNIALTLASVGLVGTYTTLITDAKGRVVTGGNLAATGDATGTAAGTSIALTLAASGAVAGTYSSFVVNSKGLVTSGLNESFSGDVSGTSSGANTVLTLATVNSNVGVFGTTTIVPTITVNAKGLVTSVSNSAIAFPVTSVFGRTGAVTLQSSDVTGALGFTPISNSFTATGDATGTAVSNTIALTLASVTTAGTFSVVSYNAKGLIISGQNLVATGDVTGTASGSGIALTLPTVNSNVGTFAGIVVNGKGQVTGATALTSLAAYNILDFGVTYNVVDGGSF